MEGDRMNITAHLVNRQATQTVNVKTGEREHTLSIPTKPDGFGSLANGGELLLLALATCYCNDLYREARKRGLTIDGVDIEVMGEYSGEGEPVGSIRYKETAWTTSPKEQVFEVMTHTDTVAEIQNTLRKSAEIALIECVVHAE
jgi:organic hydroperoxide reductase OsmC/OhrA